MRNEINWLNKWLWLKLEWEHTCFQHDEGMEEGQQAYDYEGKWDTWQVQPPVEQFYIMT